MFYLTTHSTHFILRLYGVGHMVKDHSDSERGNPLPPHGQQGFFYMHHLTDRITHTTAFVTPVVEHLPTMNECRESNQRWRDFEIWLLTDNEVLTIILIVDSHSSRNTS